MQFTIDVFGDVVEHRGSHEVPEERRLFTVSIGVELQDPVGTSLLRIWSGTCTASGVFLVGSSVASNIFSSRRLGDSEWCCLADD